MINVLEKCEELLRNKAKKTKSNLLFFGICVFCDEFF